MPVWGLTHTSWSHTGKIACPDWVIKSGFSYENVQGVPVLNDTKWGVAKSCCAFVRSPSEKNNNRGNIPRIKGRYWKCRLLTEGSVEEEKQQQAEARKSGWCLGSVCSQQQSFQKSDRLWILVCQLGVLTPAYFAGLGLESNDSMNVKALLTP